MNENKAKEITGDIITASIKFFIARIQQQNIWLYHRDVGDSPVPLSADEAITLVDEFKEWRDEE